jgi:NTP pyrophosphatase (non-canonical NTP hydrolase)
VTSPSPGAASTGEMSRLFDEAIAGLSALARLQQQYDDDMWEIDEPAFANLRHIHLHLSSTVGKIAKIVEPRDHESYRGEIPSVKAVKEELAPILADLVMHASQIARMVDGDLGLMIKERYRQNASRFARGTVFESI